MIQECGTVDVTNLTSETTDLESVVSRLPVLIVHEGGVPPAEIIGTTIIVDLEAMGFKFSHPCTPL